MVTTAKPFTLSGAITHSALFNSQGTNSIKGTPYTGWGNKSPVYALESKASTDATTSSTAGMVDTAGSLISMAGREPTAAGAVNVYELSGFFGDTANDRSVVINEPYSGDIFDSGVLAAADVRNKLWKLKITMQRTGSHAKRFVSEFEVSGAPKVIQTDTTATASAGSIVMRCDSIAAGDVQVLTYFSKSEFVP